MNGGVVTIRQAVISQVLLEFDGPEIVVARDVFGLRYLALLVARDDDGDLFFAVPVSPGRLASVISGQIDLRAAFAASESGEHFQARFRRIDNGPTLLLDPLADVVEEWLPDAGLLLTDFIGAPEMDSVPDVAVAAGEMNSAVVVLSLHPPEATDGAQIDAYRLGDALRVFQNLVKHAYTKAAGTYSSTWRATFGGADAYNMQVFAFSEGSFRVHLHSRVFADLSGTSALGSALAKVDELTANLDQPDVVLDVVQQNRGHVVSAYLSLLRFVVEQNTPVEYHWADPGSRVVHSRRISEEAATAVYKLLQSRQELGIEEVEFVGVFDKVNVSGGTWTLKGGNSEIHGEMAEGAPSLLPGVTVSTQLYRIYCEERLEEVAGSGRQKTRYLLTKLTPLV